MNDFKDISEVYALFAKMDNKISDLERTVSEQGAEIGRLNRLVDKKDGIISRLNSKVVSLESRLAKYEGPSQDSHNSNTPPSKEPLKSEIVRRTKSLREKSSRHTGGQKGHKGFTIEMDSEPDFIEKHQAPLFCECCGMPLDDVEAECCGTYQVVDIPRYRPLTTTHLVYGRKCQCGHVTKGEKPKECGKYVTYGPNIRALVSFLSEGHFIPYKRLCEILRDVFGVNISQGSIKNILDKQAEKSKPAYNEIKERLILEAVIGSDGSGMFVNGDHHWAYAIQNNRYTYAFQDKSRSKFAIRKHFPDDFPDSILVTDRLGTYFQMNVAGHQVCLAHLLRNLQYLTELDKKQTWSKRVASLLRLSIKKRKTSDFKDITQGYVTRIKSMLNKLLTESLNNLHEEFGKLQRGIKRCQKYVFTFLENPNVPYDNNASERAIRVINVKGNVSGCFRSDKGADDFMILHSIMDTAKKSNNSKFEAMLAIARL